MHLALKPKDIFPRKECVENCQKCSKVLIAQCGNFNIFSISQILCEINFGESISSEIVVFAILGAYNFVNGVNFSLQKVQKFIIIQI